MNWIIQCLWVIPALPLLAAGVTAVAKRRQRALAAALAIGSMGVAFVLSCAAFSQTLSGSSDPEVPRQVFKFTWLQFGDAPLQLGWVLDPLTAVMLVMVTFVGSLIFIYSVGYMAQDENFTRFFCFLALFAAAMLGLVIANSLLLLFVCWELVGLSSYLLIGFWYHKPSAAAAAKKAFIVTRIGDIGFFLGILWLYSRTGTLLFYDGGNGCLEQLALTRLVAQTTSIGIAVSTGISLLIFCGAIGKSGQVPLHVWLPDAMEGPTPVSALIHAATMVAAGVFLVARVYPLMAATPGDAMVAVGTRQSIGSEHYPADWQRETVGPLHEPTVRSPGFSRFGPPEGGTPNKWRLTHGFMVPTRAQERMGAFHEPTHPRPLPGGEQAFVHAVSAPLLGGVRGGFMVPMQAKKRKEAFHEPQVSASVWPAKVRGADGRSGFVLAQARSPGRRDALPYVGVDRVYGLKERVAAAGDSRAGTLTGGEGRGEGGGLTGRSTVGRASTALKVVTWIGATTALFAALIAVAQTDIKRILAYSTVSQLGYMMMGLGAGGVAVGMFHLITHAFFKALLFLGAGSVIHGCHDQQDIRYMGGLKGHMPVTFATYAIGMMALSGVPLLFSGFWSKDEILHAAWLWEPSKWPFLLGLAGAFLTAFYMTRQICFVFFGSYRGGARENAGDSVPKHRSSESHRLSADNRYKPHESPPTMTVPLVILAAFSILLGFIGTPAWPWFQQYLGAAHEETAWGGVVTLMLISTLVVFTGIGVGGLIYGLLQPAAAGDKDTLESLLPFVFAVLRDRFYVDELYEATIVRATEAFCHFSNWLDSVVLDSAVLIVSYSVLGLSWLNRVIDEYLVNPGFDEACRRVRLAGGLVSRLQDGRVQNYLRVLGLALTVLLLLLAWGCGK